MGELRAVLAAATGVPLEEQVPRSRHDTAPWTKHQTSNITNPNPNPNPDAV